MRQLSNKYQRMVPTKQEIEQKIKKMAVFVDSTISRASNLLDAVANDPEELEKQVRQAGKQSADFLRKQKLELEIRILKLRLQEVERKIEVERGNGEGENTQP